MLMAMAFFNALYMYDLVTHHKVLEAGSFDGVGLDDNERGHLTIGRHIVEEIKKGKEAKKLKIKILSSKEEAKIFVNDKEVLHACALTGVTVFCCKLPFPLSVLCLCCFFLS